MKLKALVLIVAVAAMAAAAGTAAAQGITSSLTGNATQEQSDVKLTSTGPAATATASGIHFVLPAGSTFAGLSQLGTEFNPTVGGCGGGSPRFSINLANGENVVVALGPSPNFTGCALNTWQSSGNLIGNNDTGRYDTSHVPGGSPFTTYAAALALVGSQPVASIDLIVDSGWFFQPDLVQTVLVRNVNINGQVFPLTSPEQGHHGNNPAQRCRAERDSIGRDAFEQKYGTNHNHRNAFGKCVSAHAHGH